MKLDRRYEFAKNVLTVKKCCASLLLYDGNITERFSAQLGVSICLDKPIALVVVGNFELPKALIRVASVIEFVADVNNTDELKAATTRVMMALKMDEKDDMTVFKEC